MPNIWNSSPIKRLRFPNLDITSPRTPGFAPEGLTYGEPPATREPESLDAPYDTSQGEEAFGGNAPANIESPPVNDPRRYQQRAVELAAQGAPMHPKHGKLRTIGEGLAKLYLGPVADELFDSDYAQQRRQYEHELKATTGAAALQRQLEADKYTEELRRSQALKNEADIEAKADAASAREDAARLRTQQQQSRESEEELKHLQEGNTVYRPESFDLAGFTDPNGQFREPPAPLDTPGITNPSPVTGKRWVVNEKPPEGMVAIPEAIAKTRGVDVLGRQRNGKVLVLKSALDNATRPDAAKEVSNPEQILLNPDKYTPAQVAEAKRLFGEKHRPPVAALQILPSVDTNKVPDVPVGQRNEEFLKTIPPVHQITVKQLADYEAKPGAISARSLNGPILSAWAKKYDPSFDPSMYEIRQKFKSDWFSTKQGAGANKIAINTAINHLDKLRTAADAMNNGNVQGVNQFVNWARTQTGNPAVTNFATAQAAISNELATVFKRSGATDQEIHKWDSTVAAKMSRGQIGGAIDTAIDLLAGRFDALENAYSEVMGKRPPSILSPQAAAILQQMGYNTQTLRKGGASPEASGAVPAVGQTFNGGKVTKVTRIN